MNTNLQSGVHKRLAAGTHNIHQLLHNHQDLGRLTSSSINSTAYFQILNFFLEAHLAAEQKRKALDIWPMFSLKRAIDALQADLVTHKPVGLHIVSMPWLTTPEHLLGALYVLHGSSIGGRFISKNIANVLPEVPLQFFGRGLEKSVWKELLAALENYQDHPDGFASILEGATKTFECFDRKLVT